MTKQGGLGDNLYVAGYDFSGDILSVGDIGGGPALKEKTAIDKSAMERIGLLRDGRLNITAAFDPAADMSHDRLSLLPATDVQLMYCRGTALGNQAAALVAKQVNYDGSRGDDGDFTFTVNAVANKFGLEWGRLLTAGKRTDGAATNGASIDTAAAAAFGAQAYLQVFAFTGTSVTVTIEDSADNVTFAAVADLAFTAATGITSERIATANTATIRRYVRAVTSGVFTNAVFAVALVKNEIAGVTF